MSKRSEFLLVLHTLVIVESQTRADEFGVHRASEVMEDALGSTNVLYQMTSVRQPRIFSTAIVLAAFNPIGHERNSRFLVSRKRPEVCCYVALSEQVR